jgi:hypothetical protein
MQRRIFQALSPARHTILTGLVLVVFAACRAPSRAPTISEDDPRTADAHASVWLSSKDVGEFATAAVDAIAARLPDPDGGGAWRIAVHPIDCKNMSALVDPDLIRNRIIASAERVRHKAVLFTPEAESIAATEQNDQFEGRRVGAEPPPGLLVHDLHLHGSLHEMIHNTAGGRSNYLQFSYRLSDRQGRVVASDAVEFRRSEVRGLIYR